MPEFEESGYAGMWIPARRLDGGHGVVLVAKRRFRVDLAEGTCVPSGEIPQVVLSTEPEDPEEPTSPIRQPGEITAEKPHTDVLLRGSAYAPGGESAPRFLITVHIEGALDRSLAILGPRKARWVPPDKWLGEKELDKGRIQQFPLPEFPEPRPIDRLELSYRFAYGGQAPLVLDDRTQELAAIAQAEEEDKEARKEREKEIEEEQDKEQKEDNEEAGGAEAAEASDPASSDEARAAFGGDASEAGTRSMGAMDLEGGAEPDAPMEVASAYHLGRDLPDRPQARAAPPDEPADGIIEDDDEAGDDEEGLPFSEGTQVLGAGAAGAAATDELARVLDVKDAERRARLRDQDGTMRVRTEGMEDVALSDGQWVDGANAEEEPEAKPDEEESPYPMLPYPANPAGRGYCVSPLRAAVEGLELPQIEEPDRPLRPEELVQDLTTIDLSALPAAAGVGPYAQGWYPRAQLAGVMPWDLEGAEAAIERSKEPYDPDDPDDALALKTIDEIEVRVMQPAFWQDAHPKMQVERLRGDEEVHLTNLSPDGRLFFRLPGTHPHATLDLGRGPKSVAMNLDTLSLDVEDPAAPHVEMIWRGWYPLASFEALEEATCIEPRIVSFDQDAWLDVRRAEEVGPEEGTQRVSAMSGDDEDDEEIPVGEAADRRHRDDLAERRRGEVEELGPAKDEGGTAIIDLDDERRLTDDSWDEEIRADKEAFEADALGAAAAQAEARDKARRAAVRAQADEEFGIVRDEDGNPIEDEG